MTLEDGLDPLPDDITWILGGLDLMEEGYGITYDEGLEGLETDTDDGDAAVDGASLGFQRIPSKLITLGVSVCPADAEPEDRAAAVDLALHKFGLVLNPAPDRSSALRTFRYRRIGSAPRRRYYRAANGDALTVPGDEARIKYHKADLVVRIECPDPVALSDEWDDIELAAGVAQTITNDGNLVAQMPPAWELTGSGTTRLQNLTHGGDVTFPSTGDLSVTRTTTGIAIVGEDDEGATYGRCYGPGSTPFPVLPLLYPGANSIKASADCTLRVWSTWS